MKNPLAKETDNNKINQVPFTGSSEEVPFVSDARVSNVKETVAGLKEAGYSLEDVVSILKNDNKGAPEISIACLSAGYSGTNIFNALKEAGFSGKAAEAAVPPALRTEGQIFSVYFDKTGKGNIDRTAMISPNPFSDGKVLTTTGNVSAGNSTGQEIINPVQVKVSVGVTFNGLGDWNKFQNERFQNR
ncbi:MAG: hypothetical protein KJ893_00910 [Candidatus Omnitrophica bacterium]|nr:hypothetical protein [Candidatus Omnitrophota bacterium]MBU4479157.1 hypothetical protein [Candidatus Omnitrophota bacterium]MCG2702796.1 hypothetical protein [Candidatus Omnitrophota bacterium]